MTYLKTTPPLVKRLSKKNKLSFKNHAPGVDDSINDDDLIELFFISITQSVNDQLRDWKRKNRHSPPDLIERMRANALAVITTAQIRVLLNQDDGNAFGYFFNATRNIISQEYKKQKRGGCKDGEVIATRSLPIEVTHQSRSGVLPWLRKNETPKEIVEIWERIDFSFLLEPRTRTTKNKFIQHIEDVANLTRSEALSFFETFEKLLDEFIHQRYSMRRKLTAEKSRHSIKSK